MKEINIKNVAITFIVALIIWFIPVPEGVTQDAWHLFAIFAATILGIILKAAPMGTMCMMAIAFTALTQVVAPGDAGKSITKALSGFGDKVIWLIGISFFIARGFIKTGLGNRIAFLFIRVFGKSSLGLAYGLGLADVCLAPAIPSNTARGGGIIYPIMKSMAISFDSVPEKPETHRKLGSFLTLNSYYMNLIASSMFLTGTASNPMCQKFAANLGIDITWMSWAAAGFLPGAVAFFVVPLVLYKLYPPELKKTGDAPKMAAQKLKEMGPISRNEWLMLLAFFILLALWIFGGTLSIDATTTAFIGLTLLLLTSVLTWEDVKGEKGAWDTIVWFAVLVMMASSLNELGFIGWFSDLIKMKIGGLSWQVAFPVIIVVYFFSHYIFASATAHVAAMYAALLGVGVSLGIPPMLLAMMLGFLGSIYGVLTHYGHGPAPVFFGSGYVDLKVWWLRGLEIGIVLLIIYMVVGGLWMKVLGYY
ncbi:MULTISPECIES: anion permease [Chryseobacterium]|jgi:DASS family divalent anion:Na+ symporter|uniref:Anion permease n=1 Tax=Chryseobacterium rhizosphaerae TaxID=395937 RepID=A0ABX9ILP5_9FLAO|nr:MULTISPECIES: anion permease [Chryseobacterium]MBL3547450.1 anion permease [Chryseobacterium sp. KMC2]MDC8099008.1 anion permease [Chryseobacterium rhizosphaerae]MDR6547780.1 DASS family divalent anion:Na+ symporter [Chryseobacterium rhizosphaerae]REC75087.1 anion permease [Chryseobacterium rhizosphaerae]SMC46912.1 divalent anion:Na+ symporter, DASS family [Chryseobacterium sp. YR221]